MRKMAAPLMGFLGNLPLQPTVGAALILGLALPALAVAWRVTSEREQSLMASLARDHARIVETLANGMQTPIWDVRPETGRPLVDVIMGDDRVTAVEVTAPVFTRPLQAVKPGAHSDAGIIKERSVVRDGETIGRVRVEMTAEPLKAITASQGWQALLTAIFQMLLGLLLIFPLLRFKVLAPVQRLVEQSRALALGKLDEGVEWRRNDELGTLGRSFDRTRRALHTLFQDLEDRNAELRAREQALQESEKLYRLLVDLSPYGILLHDHTGIQFMNRAGCQMLGVTDPSTIIGRNYLDFIAESDRAHGSDRLARILSGEVLEQTERRLSTPDGRELVVATSGVPFARGSERLALIIFVDITEMKQAEREIARQREALHQADKISALGSLLARVAHELNNPLSIVLGRANLLSETELDPTSMEAVGKIKVAANRCARIVRTFLAMARQQAPVRLPVRIEQLIDSSLDLLSYGLKSAGVNVVKQAQSDIPTTMADPDQLSQVFNNLISNAVQVMIGWDGPRELKIIVTFDPDSGQIVVVCSDSGPGIPADLRDRIFDPFFTTKPEGAGTGIGLAVCRSNIEAHGGTIRVLSSEQGAAFEILLPVVDRSTPSEPEAGDEPTAPPAARVLIVDDESEIRDMVAEILALDGHAVEQAGSGEQALALLAQGEFDVIISDLLMPSLDGPSLFDRLSKERPDLAARLMFITGDTLSPSIRGFLERAQRPVLEKPFSPSEIRRAVAEALRPPVETPLDG